MALTVTTDHDAISSLLDDVLAADPVRGTVLGTIRGDLRDTAWCASSPDGTAISVRSSDRFPVVTAGAWDGPSLRELAALLDVLPALAGLSGAVDLVEGVDEALRERRPRLVAHRTRHRLFRLDDLTMPVVAGHARPATGAERDVVSAWYTAFVGEAGINPVELDGAVDAALASGCWLWLDDGAPVAMATRRPVVAGSARVGPVYTPPEVRGRGYGSAVTAAATRAVLDEGAIPVLFTDLANPVSNAIYPRLGYHPVGDYAVIGYR